MSSISGVNNNASAQRYAANPPPAVEKPAAAAASQPAQGSSAQSQPAQKNLFAADGFDSKKAGSADSGQDLSKVLQDVAQVVDQLSQLLEQMQVPELGNSQPQQNQGAQQGQGSQGQGTQGTQGQGTQGTQGQGSQGSQGTQGQGSQGTQGQGSQGTQGTQGQGSQGSQGTQGQGSQGSQGTQGQGSQGTQGQGSQGTQGQGTQGTQGTQGQGTQGTQGQGTQGQGTQGTQGQGTQGTQGKQGQGTQGQGTQGTQGQGTQGTQGTQKVGDVSKSDEGYGVKEAVADIDKLSQNHQLSGENRGVGDAQRGELDKNKTAIAEAAMAASKRYFPEMSVKDGTRLILADASLESTFNPKLNAESGQVDPDKTVGLLQARGESNLADFKKHASGEGLKRADGSPWDPKQTENNDLAKIWENIHVGAWYMSSAARAGATSANEHFDMGKQGPRQTDVTTGLLSHFMGPGGAAENKPGQNEGADRYLRIVGGELDVLDPGSSQRILGSVLDPKRVV